MSVGPFRWGETHAAEFSALGRPGQVTLIVGERHAAIGLLNMLAAMLDQPTVSISESAFASEPVTSTRELMGRIETAELLYDLECLCWKPWLQVDPIRFLKQLARERGIIAIWPGDIHGYQATFSTPGRLDHVQSDIRGLSIMRPLPTQFPDEVPFILERILS